MIVLVTVGASTYSWGYRVVNVDIISQSIAPSLIAKIGTLNATMFGLYNLILSTVVFLVLSMCFRHWSKNCKHSPWISITSRINKR